MSSPDVTVEFEASTQGDVAVAAIRGRLDAARVADIKQQVSALPETGVTQVVLELSGLEWIDSSGVGLLVLVYKKVKANGGRVNVACLQRQPQEIFRLLRLESAFTIFDTLESAVADFGGG